MTSPEMTATTASLTHVRARPREVGRVRPAWTLLGAGLVLAGSVAVVRDATYTGAAIAGISLVAIVAMFVGIRRHRPQRVWFWVLCASALSASVVTGVATSVLPPSAATVVLVDGLYLAGYSLLVLAGLLTMPVRGASRDWAGILDALALAIAGATLFWYYAMSPALASSLTFHTTVTAIIWPIYDLLLIVVLSRLATSGAPREFPFVMVTLALASSVVTDFWYAATASSGGYVWGSVADAFWVLPMATLGAAALHPAMRTFAVPVSDPPRRITWVRVFLVGFGAFSVPIAIAILALRGGDLEASMPLVLIGSALLAVTGLARTAEMVRQSRNTAEEAQALAVQLRNALAERERLHGELEQAALYDPLTGLANRRLFQQRLDSVLDGQDSCAVLFIDLDDFKNINDSLGHAVGDRALVELGGRIDALVGAEDLVARIGGDEFAVLLPDATPREVRDLGRRLLHVVGEPVVLGRTSLQLSISIGAADSTGATGRDDLLRNADIAMYAAKGAGKNQLAVFEDEMRRTRLERLELHAALQRALDEEELEMVYQPVVDLRDGYVDGVEALVRWHRPDGRPIPTQELIDLAEETGLIRQLGRWVLREATDQARRWQTDGLALNIGVNVSATQLSDPWFIGAVRHALDTLGQDQTLVIEMTESALIGGDSRDLDVLRELRELGCRIAIDDFGTGFSSLAYLTELPIDILKLAAPFVTGIDESRDGATVASAVLQLGQALGYRVVAEGIERRAEAAALQLIGCHLGQGFLFARPASADVLQPWLVQRNRRLSPNASLDPLREAPVPLSR